MDQVLLLVVAAVWAAVLLPPLIRSRLENRPNSSVLDFRNQLSSLQRAMPTRGVAVRSMGRSLVPSTLSRPAAPGRPGTRSNARADGVVSSRLAPTSPTTRPSRRDQRLYEASLRPRQHGGGGGGGGSDVRVGQTPVGSRAAEAKRRRANVLFLLVLTSVCTGFLAATTDSKAMVYVFAISMVALGGFVYLLVSLNQQAQLGAQAARPRRSYRNDYEEPRVPQGRRGGYVDDGYGHDGDDVWAQTRPTRRPPQRQRRDDYRDPDETRYADDRYAMLPGSGESGRISYGRGAVAGQPTRRDPRDRYGREAYGWEQGWETRSAPARNGRHATGQVPAQRPRRLQAVRDYYSHAG